MGTTNTNLKDKWVFFSFTASATLREEDSSDDNRSSILGRQSDDASIASDYQDEGASECELTVDCDSDSLCLFVPQYECGSLKKLLEHEKQTQAFSICIF